MASNVEEHILKLDDKFSRKLDAIDSKVNRFRGGIDKTKGSLSGIGAIAGRVFIGLGVGLLAKKVATLGIEMEQTRVAFSTFLGSAEKGNKLIAELNQFANITPFNNAEIIKSGRLLLAAGIEADAVTGHLKAIGDVAAGSNVPITELSAIFQKAFTKGKLQAEELNQFAERGIPIIAELAKKFGLKGEGAAAQVLKLGSQGKITKTIMVEAFAAMSGEGGIFFNLMELQSKTVGGRISTFVGKLQLIGIELGERLNPLMGKFVDVGLRMVEFLATNTEAIIDLAKWVVKIGVAFVIYKVAMIGSTVALKIARVASIAYRITVLAMNKGILTTIRSLKVMKTALASTGLGLLALALVEIASSFFNFGDDVDDATDKLDEFGNKVQEINNIEGKRIFDKLLGPTIDTVTGKITQPSLADFAKSLEGLQTGKLNLLEGFLQDRIPDIRREISNLSGVGKTIAQQRMQTLQSALNLLQTEAGKAVISTPGGAGDKLKSGLATVRSGAPKNITINIDSLIEEQIFNTGDLKESTARIKDIVTRVLLEAINDAQVIAR